MIVLYLQIELPKSVQNVTVCPNGAFVGLFEICLSFGQFTLAVVNLCLVVGSNETLGVVRVGLFDAERERNIGLPVVD